MKPTWKYIYTCKLIPFPVLIMGVMLLLSSCLKDTREDLSKSPPLVGFLFPNPGFYPPAGGFVVSRPLTFSSTPQTVTYDSTSAYPAGNNAPLEIELSYTGFPRPYSGPVTVTIGVDTTEISIINAANGTNFQVLPAGSYTLPNNGQVTIQPAQSGKYPVALVYSQVTTSRLDTSLQYILPLKITAVQQSGIVIATNLNQAAMEIVVH